MELAGDIGKHSQSQRKYEQNLAEMTPEELSAVIDRWKRCGWCLTGRISGGYFQ